MCRVAHSIQYFTLRFLLRLLAGIWVQQVVATKDSIGQPSAKEAVRSGVMSRIKPPEGKRPYTKK
jgi:hypothetical protein